MANTKKKNYMSETKFLFAGLLGNYVTCCRSIFIVWKNAATVWLILTLSFCKGIVKDVVKQAIWFLAYWFFEHGIVKQGNRFALKLEKATKASLTGFFCALCLWRCPMARTALKHEHMASKFNPGVKMIKKPQRNGYLLKKLFVAQFFLIIAH